VALLFLRPPLGVEIHQSLQDRLFGPPRVSAVRGGHDGVQLVVQLLEDADQALLMDCAPRRIQVPAGPLRGILIQGTALLLEHVVERGHRQIVVGVQLLLAVRIQLRPEVADWGPLRLGGRREKDGGTSPIDLLQAPASPHMRNEDESSRKPPPVSLDFSRGLRGPSDFPVLGRAHLIGAHS